MWPYFYPSGLHPGALPFSVGQMLLGGAAAAAAVAGSGNPGQPGLPSPFFPGGLGHHNHLGDVTTTSSGTPTFPSPHAASWASHLALASHPMLYQHYAAAMSQAAAAAASIAVSSAADTLPSSSSSPATSSIGALLSSRLPQRFTPYTIPAKRSSTPSSPVHPLTPPSGREDSPRASPEGERQHSPATSSQGNRTPSELKNMELMVCGLERQQEKLATETLTKLVDK